MSKKEIPDFTQNRELSWLRFNQRVLEEARDESVPLMERMKFVAIFTSNLDEFFMIRVGSLYDLAATDDKKIDQRSGMTAKQQLDAIYRAVSPLYKERDKTYAEIKKQLDANHPFPHLLSKEIYVVANLKQGDKAMLGIIPVPQYISNILYLPGYDIRYIRMEKIILEFAELVFNQYQVSDKNYICVTRNADVSPDDEAYADHGDFRHIMKETLHKRKKMAVVRLEAANPLSKELEKYFCEKFKIGPECIFRTKMPMKLDFIFAIADKLPESMKRTLVDEPFSPQPAAMLHEGSVMEQVKKKDVLLSYPYESMEPFLQMIREAASDPDVLTIKITIYRLAKKARLVEYLCAAAENGKEVTVLIELRARFDEQNNIEWSERLEEAGCRVLYGFEGYKVHSKICLITYRSKSEPNNKNEIRYITQIGTGNYNEKTAKMYTDYSLMTANQEIGTDAAEFFKNMSIGNLHGAYRHLIVSPVSLKARVLATMDEEIEKGSAGRIIMKMNSVTDVDFIRKVEEASCAGVKVDLIVRGICCILPQVPGHTENVRVTSIVGRYLEHPRVFVFGKGEKTKIYIGSADMMTRNTEKRVEVACPVYDEAVKKRLLHQLKVMLADNVKAREMAEDGTYHKKAESGRKINAQETFMQEALHARKEETREMREQKNTGVIKRVLGFFRRRK